MKRRGLVSLLSVIGILALGITALLLLVSFRAEAAAAESVVEARVVRTTVLVPENQATFIVADGFLESAGRVDIFSPVAGRVTFSEGNLKGGTPVEEGQLLVALDDRRARLAFESARSAMLSTGSRFATAAGLNASAEQAWSGYLMKLSTASAESLPAPPSLGDRESLLAATMGVTAARTALESAALDLADHRINAPFSGSLSGEGLVAGSLVSPGQILAVLMDTRRLELSLALPMDSYADISAGSDAVLSVDDGEHEIRGTVVRVEPALSPGSQAVKVHVSLEAPEDSAWMPGAWTTARIAGPVHESSFRVPRTALVNGRLPVYDKGVLELLEVDVLAYDGEDVIFGAAGIQSLEMVTTVLQKPVEGLQLERESAS